MISRIKETVAPYLKNLEGWSTSRKIIVIESDDWGSIRMPSREVYEKCLAAGYRVDKIAYERYDSLASESDLELLFDLLAAYKDRAGNHPAITANILPANPDFRKIEESAFAEYHWEPVTDTLKRYPEHGGVLELWKEGMQRGLFFPQSHGREHLNTARFMNALQQGDEDVHFGFQHGVPGMIPHGDHTRGGNRYVVTLEFDDEAGRDAKLPLLLEGLDLFEQLFGFRSESFTPPNYLWYSGYDEAMAGAGVRYYQGNRRMKEPLPGGRVRLQNRKSGEVNSYGQRYLVRNAHFEPSLFSQGIRNPADRCLAQIRAAFRMRRPAVICSHRINYVGFIDPANRDRNLPLLRKLLDGILTEWPDVEFMTSVQLGNLIAEES